MEVGATEAKRRRGTWPRPHATMGWDFPGDSGKLGGGGSCYGTQTTLTGVRWQLCFYPGRGTIRNIREWDSG